jgi:hypothetical protein
VLRDVLARKGLRESEVQFERAAGVANRFRHHHFQATLPAGELNLQLLRAALPADGQRTFAATGP